MDAHHPWRRLESPVILVHTNVIVDVLKADPVWLPWSSRQLMLARRTGSLCINYVVYAELAVHEEVAQEMDALLDGMGIVAKESTVRPRVWRPRRFASTASAAASVPGCRLISSSAPRRWPTAALCSPGTRRATAAASRRWS